MKSRREAEACLSAAFEPSEPGRKPIYSSRTIKEAIRRMEQEAVELEEVATGKRPFSETVHDIVERMK